MKINTYLQILHLKLMEGSRGASILWFVPILILYPILSISAYLARTDEYFNIDKQYQHYLENAVRNAVLAAGVSLSTL